LTERESEHQQGQERETLTTTHHHRGLASMNRDIQKGGGDVLFGSLGFIAWWQYNTFE